MRKLNGRELCENIEKIAEYDLTENNLFGSSYAVWQGGECIFRRHYGYADGEGKRPVDDGTVYRLASMTKPITGLGALILADRGLISLDRPVKEYIEGFDGVHVVTEDGEDLGATKTEVTLLHLLTHTSGLGSLKPFKLSFEDAATKEKMIGYFLGLGLDFEPATRQAYSGIAGFDAVGEVIERVSGESLESFFRREIFEPLGMTDTTFIPSAGQQTRMMTMHNKVGGGSRVGRVYDGCVFEYLPCEHMAAGAGLVSTLGDYERFALALLGGCEGLVSGESFELYHKPYVPAEVMKTSHSWGLGVRVMTDEEYGTLPVGAYGWSGAYGTHFWVDPVNDIAAVFMKNSRFDGGANNKSAKRFEAAVYDALEI